LLPVVPHFQTQLESRDLLRVRELAKSLRHVHPALIADRGFDDLCVRSLTEGRALVFDDISGTMLAERHRETVVLQERAVLRATTGDVVVACSPTQPAFQDYCREILRLGEVEWLHPRETRNPMRVAVSAWTDRTVRRRLVHLLREGRLQHLHPYMADAQAWTLARLLRSSARRPLSVIGPPPGLCRLVNDKAWFARAVRGLFGPKYLPRTFVVYNVGAMAQIAGRLAKTANSIVIKLPGSSGGAGNVRLDTTEFLGRDVGAIRAILRERLPVGDWAMPRRMVISCWTSDVLCTPSVQLWIPPADDGEPVIEGVFEQLIDDPTMKFRGSRALSVPRPVMEDLVGRTHLLGLLFQQLGYVGRCSFDLILVGPDLDSCRLEFIECNGRWGGTSIPMTLMNRLIGDWASRPYATRCYRGPDITQIRPPDLLRALGDSLFDPLGEQGGVVLMDVAGVGTTGRLDVLAVGKTWADVDRHLDSEVPGMIESLASTIGATGSASRPIVSRPPPRRCRPAPLSTPRG